MSLLDIDERILDLVERIDFNRSPINDIKAFTERCRIGLIEGGCANQANVETIQEFRSHCDILISVGDCAINGGVPAMRNTIPLKECFQEAYFNSPTAYNPERIIPADPEVPLLLDRVHPCHQVVEIDYYLPGCPPPAEAFWQALVALVNDEPVELPYELIKYD
jgi:NAD-reducing hydrogenase small subunit